MSVCALSSAAEIAAKLIFPEFLNHSGRLQKAKEAADVLVLSLQKQRQSWSGEHIGGGGEKEGNGERRVRMTKGLTGVTVEKKKHIERGMQTERRRKCKFVACKLLLQDHPNVCS